MPDLVTPDCPLCGVKIPAGKVRSGHWRWVHMGVGPVRRKTLYCFCSVCDRMRDIVLGRDLAGNIFIVSPHFRRKGVT